MSKRAASGSSENDVFTIYNIYYGCFFCRSGSEERIIHEMSISHPQMDCIVPKRVRIRRQGEKETVTLFPGYIFFRISSSIDFRALVQKTDVYKLLQYPNGDWVLHGADLKIAMMIFEMGGVFILSKACYNDTGIQFLSGPLKEYENHITKIDKRAKTARVTMVFHGREMTLWLGYEIENEEKNS